MKKLPGTVRLFVYGFLLIIFCFLAATSLAVISAQETTIPGPELKDASFVPVKDLQVGDWVFVKSGEGELLPVRISNLEYKEEPVEVYNLSVEGEQTFFANDFAVHNKFGEHDAVCDVTLAPRLSTAPTETWSISSGRYSGQAFKNLFKHSGSTWGPFQADEGKKICLWGSVINGCQYPPNKVLPAGNPCRGCDKTYGTDCSSAGCNPQCEMTCGTGGSPLYGNSIPDQSVGPDRIRFRSAFLFCDECGCGAAIKVTAPSGYIIKSITADVKSRMHDYSNPNIHGHLYFSRGMGWSLECSMKPYAVHYMVPSSYDGRLTVGLGGGTKYFFIYHLITSAGVEEGNWVGVDLRDNWAELSNIELKVVKIGEVTGERVSVINNSLLYYEGVNVTNPDLSNHWPTIQSGTISISTNGLNWSPPVEIGYNWTVDGTLPQGAEGYKNVWARIVPTGSIAGDPATCLMTTYYKPPNEPPDCTSLTLNGEPASGGHEVIQGETVNLVAQPTDTDGTVGEVRFYYSPNISSNQCNGWQLIGTDTNGADGWSVTWDTSSVPEDDYYVFARVKDDDSVWCDNPILCGADGATKVCLTDCRATVTIKFIADAWYQTQEGDAHGQSGVSSLIPKTCEENPLVCDPNFSLLGVGGFWGIISHYGGSANFNEGYPSNSEANHWLASGTLMQRQSFAYFYQLLGLPSTDELGDTVDLGDLPPDTDADGVYYSDGDVTISGALPADTKAIVLVGNQTESRNVTINNDITVPLGSSLVVIASGNIAIADAVDQVDGIYVADGTISTGAGDTEFFGSGSFIAGSFNLGRDFTATNPDDERNNTTPVEHFSYRPDLIINSPTKLWAAPLNWQELPP